MSAIFGIIQQANDAPVAREDLESMLAALARHGPDSRGIWVEGAVGLGQLLMSFTIEDRFERQPLTGAGGQLVLVADARLDNRAELAAQLALAPNAASLLPDSAFILRSYERWGADCPRYLVGSFAFAL